MARKFTVNYFLAKKIKPDRAAPAAKRVQDPCAIRQTASVPVRPATPTARARQRELGQVCAAREDIAEDGEHIRP